jgi:hypothetical protein
MSEASFFEAKWDANAIDRLSPIVGSLGVPANLEKAFTNGLAALSHFV